MPGYDRVMPSERASRVARYASSVFAVQGAIYGVGGVVCCVLALAAGLGVQSFAFLAAGLWWAVVGSFWARRARKQRRVQSLRVRRVERLRERRDVAD